MNQYISESEPLSIFNTKQVAEILNAILASKYSWACFLILDYAGYSPKNYLPYRTYIRLIKDNRM